MRAACAPASCARSRQRRWLSSAPRDCNNCQKIFHGDHQSYNIPGNDVLVLPAELVAETANSAVLAAGLEAEDTESLRNDHTLLLVVGRRDTLEGLKALHSGGTTGGLVRNHAADSSPEHLGGGTEVEGTWPDDQKLFV